MTGAATSDASPTPDHHAWRGPAEIYLVGVLLCSAAAYGLNTAVLGHLTSSESNLQLGRMWAVIAAVFVFHLAWGTTARQAVVRSWATLVSFALTSLWFAFLPPSWYALLILLVVSAAVPVIVGRRQDAVTAMVTTAVVVQVAALDPDDAKIEPALRLLDTALGIVPAVIVGLVLARLLPASFRRHRRQPAA